MGGSAGILPAAFRILRGALHVFARLSLGGVSRFPGGTPTNAARMAALPADKESKNQRKCFVRRRSSKPLVISPSVVNVEVTSGTAVRLLPFT
jgi:hypothetical protein